MAQSSGQAADYYNLESVPKVHGSGQQRDYYQQQPAPQGYGAGPQMQYQQPPPDSYQQSYQQQPPQQTYQQPYQQQPYAPPPPNPQQKPGYDPNQPPPYGYQTQQQAGPGDYTFDQAFKVEKPKWNDLWAGILFLAFVGGFIAVSGIAIRGYATTRSTNGDGIYNGRDTFSLSTNTLILFVFCLAVALVLSWCYIWIARLFPKQLIYVTLVLNIISAFVTGIWMVVRGSLGGIMFIVFGVFLMFMYWSWRKRIPFSVLMLQTSIDVAKNFGHVYLVSLLGGIVAVALGAWYAVTIVAIFARWSPGNNPACSTTGDCSNAKVTGLIVFVTFTMYWMSEWLKNTIHTTISGVYGAWYYSSQNYPQKVTRGALRRSLTYSFGSISLGSLFVAIINFLRQLCSVAYQTQAGEGGFVGMCMYCVLQCILSLIQWAVEFINRYAFSYIALFGKAYFPAAKATWTMIKDRGIDALINECLIGPVLSFGALFVAYTCSLLAYLYLLFTHPSYNTNGEWTAVIVLFSFLIGLQIANVFTTPISSGVDTIFVAAAWDPEVLMRDHPDIYHSMVRVYPHVQTAIHA